MEYDYVIIGGGIYGLYLSKELSKTKSVLLIEMDNSLFSRASYVNQARLHNGYHYPRSLETASVAANYYDKFIQDFSESINDEFDHIYAISKKGSKVDSEYFENFCNEVNIPFDKIDNNLFKKNSIENAYSVKEYSFDYDIVKNKLLEDNNSTIRLKTHIIGVDVEGDKYVLTLNDGTVVKCGGVFNTTYASTNQIIRLFGLEQFKAKYQICEMILCDNPVNLDGVGITVMDGLFFSLMPFGKQGIYSLSSVQYTPHHSVYDDLPKLPCQTNNVSCNEFQLNNCNICPNKPKTNLNEMVGVVDRFMDGVDINNPKSIFAIKILNPNSDKDDNRLVYRKYKEDNPFLISIFSGKISSIYELDDLIEKYK
jgi:hypothetical protein